MASFDDAEQQPPPPDERAGYRMPPWAEAPSNVLPTSVALDLILVLRDDLAVWVAEARAYPSGVAFSLNTRTREPRNDQASPFFSDIEADWAKLAVLFADGSRATFGGGDADRWPSATRPDHPTITAGGGSGYGTFSTEELWLWPLPPPGPLSIVFAWPAERVSEMRLETDATPIVEAAERAIELWPDDRPLPPGYRSS